MGGVSFCSEPWLATHFSLSLCEYGLWRMTYRVCGAKSGLCPFLLARTGCQSRGSYGDGWTGSRHDRDGFLVDLSYDVDVGANDWKRMSWVMSVERD